MHSSIGQVKRLASWLVFKKQEVQSNKRNTKAHKTWQVESKEEILIIKKITPLVFHDWEQSRPHNFATDWLEE